MQLSEHHRKQLKEMKRHKLTKAGRRVVQVAVAAAVAVGVILLGNLLQPHQPRHQHLGRSIDWEMLESDEGSDLNRLETPHGWVVENTDGYMLFIPDHDKEWLPKAD